MLIKSSSCMHVGKSMVAHKTYICMYTLPTALAALTLITLCWNFQKNSLIFPIFNFLAKENTDSPRIFYFLKFGNLKIINYSTDMCWICWGTTRYICIYIYIILCWIMYDFYVICDAQESGHQMINHRSSSTSQFYMESEVVSFMPNSFLHCTWGRNYTHPSLDWKMIYYTNFLTLISCQKSMQPCIILSCNNIIRTMTHRKQWSIFTKSSTVGALELELNTLVL
jgi:hypothetical protein